MSFTPTPPDSKSWKIVPFKTEKYPRGEYLLADGTILIIDFVMKKIKASGKILPNGNQRLVSRCRTYQPYSRKMKDM